MDICSTNDDFVASFPFDADLDAFENKIEKLLASTTK
jgi:hypothetical protein